MVSGTTAVHVVMEKRLPDDCTGGHTKAGSYRSFSKHEEEHGLEEAIKVARLEYATIKATHDLARSYDIDCASNPCDTVDIFYSKSHLESGKQVIARMQETMGADDPAAAYHIYSAEEAQARFLTPDALGAFVYPAGSISAYAFTIGLLKRCLSRGLNLQTETPALSITSDAPSSTRPRWTVETPKGRVSTPNLILATNGYTPHLLPSTQGLIVPLRGQVSAQRPGSKLPAAGLGVTYSFIYDTGYEYMIPRPPLQPDSGTIVIGGGLGTLPSDGAEEFGNTDDTNVNATLTTYLNESTARYFGSNWGDDDARGRIVREWTGIMGASADGLPYVGAVPGSPGLWASVSFNGHGMVLCLKCAEALVGMITDSEASVTGDTVSAGWKEWFPECMTMKKSRFDKTFTGLGMKAPGEAEFGDRRDDGQAPRPRL